MLAWTDWSERIRIKFATEAGSRLSGWPSNVDVVDVVDVVVVVVVVVGCKNLATNFALEQSLSECSGDVDGVAFVDASHVPLKVLKRNDKEIFNILE